MSVAELNIHNVTRLEVSEEELLKAGIYTRRLIVHAKHWNDKEPKEAVSIILFSNDLDKQELEVRGKEEKVDGLVADLQNAKVEVEYPDEPELTQGYSIITITFAGKEYKDVTDFIDAIQKRLSE